MSGVYSKKERKKEMSLCWSVHKIREMASYKIFSRVEFGIVKVGEIKKLTQAVNLPTVIFPQQTARHMHGMASPAGMWMA